MFINYNKKQKDTTLQFNLNIPMMYDCEVED